MLPPPPPSPHLTPIPPSRSTRSCWPRQPSATTARLAASRSSSFSTTCPLARASSCHVAHASTAPSWTRCANSTSSVVRAERGRAERGQRIRSKRGCRALFCYAVVLVICLVICIVICLATCPATCPRIAVLCRAGPLASNRQQLMASPRHFCQVSKRW